MSGGNGAGEAVAAPAKHYADLPDYEALIRALERRRLELDVSYAALAEAASLQPGFVSGAMGASRTRRFGWLSLFLIAARLGLRTTFLDDPELLGRYPALPKRQANQSRPNNYASPVGKRQMSRVFKHLAVKGGKARFQKMTKAERSEHQRKAANARWFKIRRATRRGVSRRLST